MAEAPLTHFEYSLEDESVSVEYNEVALEDGRNRFTSVWSIRGPVENEYWFWPAFRALRDQYSKDYDQANAGQFERTVGFAAPTIHRNLDSALGLPILRYLGYERQSTGDRSSSGSVVTTEFTYPSAQTFNRFMDRVFGDDGSARFQVYPGGEFPAAEFIDTMIKDGRVLVARDAPYSAHDMADHALGWLAIPPGVFQAIREAAAKYQNREEIVIEIADRLDSLSDRTAYHVVIPPISPGLQVDLDSNYRNHLSCVGDGQSEEPYLDFVHLPSVEGAYGSIASDTIERAKAAQTYAEQHMQSA